MQLIGIFALVASLVFVGFQVKQAQEIAESETYQARVATPIEPSSMRASNPVFTSAIAKTYSGHSDESSAQEKVVVEFFFGAEMTLLENHHFQFESGYLPLEHWEKNLADLRCNLSPPMFREITNYWNWRSSFQAVIDEFSAEVVTNPSNCWE
jgi:hypothetical protein